MTKVLIVDDEIPEQRHLSDILYSSFSGSVTVQCADNGEEAVSQASLWNPDIILMDIEMPLMNGIEATKRILENDPRVRIIFITAYSLFEYAREAVKLRVSDYILKPVVKEEVVAAIQKALDSIGVQRQLEGLRNGDESEAGEKGAQIVRKLKRWIEKNYSSIYVSLDSVGEMLSISPAYLSSIFKKYSGTNFSDYLSDVRTNAAKELLKDPLRSMGEIARMTGYENGSYFCRAFKKKTGFTPSEYRKNRGYRGGEA